jgi:N-acetylglucosamine-6-phosphate deacetylase
MPSATFGSHDCITKFTNCRLVRGDELVEEDLWVSSVTGKIMRSQEEFYSNHTIPDRIIDLGGRILSPGLIDVQLNGAYGFNFSTPMDDMSNYGKTLRQVNKSLISTGVTSYLPTVTSQKSEVYHKVKRHANPWVKYDAQILRYCLSLGPRATSDLQKTAPNHWVRTLKAHS